MIYGFNRNLKIMGSITSSSKSRCLIIFTKLFQIEFPSTNPSPFTLSFFSITFFIRKLGYQRNMRNYVRSVPRLLLPKY